MAAAPTPHHDSATQALALRVALSPAFQAFFGSTAAPEEWEKLVATWGEDLRHTMTLILDEEDSMRKDLGVEILRKKETNKTQFLQALEKSRVMAHHSSSND